MKKIITPLVLCFGLLLNSATAQEGAYLNVYGAYALPAASSNDLVSDGVFDVDTFAVQTEGEYEWYDQTVTYTENGDGDGMYNVNTSVSKVNLGKGLNFGVAFGYMFNDNIGAELGLGYFLGGKSTFSQKYVDEVDATLNSTLTGEIYANQMRINPSLVVSTDFHDFVPYAKFGVVVGFGTKVTETYSYEDLASDYNTVQTFESKGGIAFGVNATLGFLYQLNKKTGIFLELTSTAMSYAPKERNLTAYTVGGKNELNDLIYLQASKTEYVKELDQVITIDTVEDPTQSTLAAQIKYPMSSFGLNLGVRFSF